MPTNTHHIRQLATLVITCAVLLLTSIMSTEAQPTETACLDTSQEVTPFAEIDLGGIIFISSADGTRAIRSPLATSYILAYADHYRIFGSTGRFSPDGKWFAFRSGNSQRANWVDRHYQYERINFVNTYTGQRVFQVPILGYSLFVGGSYPMYLKQAEATQSWLSSTTYIIHENRDSVASNTEAPLYIADTITGTKTLYTGPLDLNETQGVVSPQGELLLTPGRVVNISTGRTVTEFEQHANPARWLGDGSGFYIRFAEPASVNLYHVDGNLYHSHTGPVTAVSQTGEWLTWGAEDSYIVHNTKTGASMDLCTGIYDIAFSPDDTQAALIPQLDPGSSQLWLLDLTTWEARPTDIYFEPGSQLVGWWPL